MLKRFGTSADLKKQAGDFNALGMYYSVAKNYGKYMQPKNKNLIVTKQMANKRGSTW